MTIIPMEANTQLMEDGYRTFYKTAAIYNRLTTRKEHSGMRRLKLIIGIGLALVGFLMLTVSITPGTKCPAHIGCHELIDVSFLDQVAYRIGGPPGDSGWYRPVQ